MKNLLLAEIERTVAAHPERGIWRSPLLACAGAGDPLFKNLKQTAHPGHLLPADLLPDAGTVIAYFLPFARQVMASNSKGREASVRWAEAYVKTNALIAVINGRLAALLGSHGFRAAVVAPTHNFDEKTLVSPWSHRHVAYIAGLGTFGLNRMLITDKGCGGRLGSMVTDAVMAADRRPKEEFCPYRRNGSCGACMKKCPTGALTATGFDRHACYGILLENQERFLSLGKADACGKCVCGLPCSEGRP